MLMAGLKRDAGHFKSRGGPGVKNTSGPKRKEDFRILDRGTTKPLTEDRRGRNSYRRRTITKKCCKGGKGQVQPARNPWEKVRRASKRKQCSAGGARGGVKKNVHKWGKGGKGRPKEP